MLVNNELDFTNKDCSVRFNSVDSGYCEEDIAQILSSENLPQTVHLPKVEDPTHLEWVSTLNLFLE